MDGMGSAVTAEVMFVGPRRTRPGAETACAEGVVRLPDGAMRAFSGWIDLLAALEAVVAVLPTAAEPSEGVA